MKRNLYIHIGYPKTGTTSIQNFLISNENILSNYNLYYPKSGISIPESGHHNLARSPIFFRDHFLYKSEFGDYPELKKEINQIDNDIIISSEGFINSLGSHESKIKMNRLINYFQNKFRIVFICFVKNPIDHYESMYFHGFKSWLAGRTSKRMVLYEQRTRHIIQNPFRYLNLLSNIVNNMKHAKIVILPYTKTDLIQSFCDVVGINEEVLLESKFNTRISNLGLRIIHNFSTSKEWEKWYNLVRQNKTGLLNLFREFDSKPMTIFTEKQTNNLMQKCRASKIKLGTMNLVDTLNEKRNYKIFFGDIAIPEFIISDIARIFSENPKEMKDELKRLL